MFRIRPDAPTAPPPSALVDQLQRVSDLMAEIQRICDAVLLVTPRHPERVRTQIVTRFNEVNQRIRRIQEQTDGMRHPPPELDAMEGAHRRLEARVDHIVAELERAQEDQVENFGASPTRRMSEDLEDQMDRGLQFGTVPRSYDGWRRRP